MWHMKTEDNSWASLKYQTQILIIPTIRNELNFTRQSSGVVKEIKILHYRKEAIIAQTETVTSTVKGEDGASKDITLSTNNNRWGAQELTLTSQMSQMIQDTFDYQSTTSQSRAWMTVESCALVVLTTKALSIQILLQLSAVSLCTPTLISLHLSRKCKKSARICMRHPGL